MKQYKINEVVYLIVIESDCVDCPKELGCVFTACPYYQVKRYYCDRCESEEDLYYWDGEQLCADCILQQLERIEYDD